VSAAGPAGARILVTGGLGFIGGHLCRELAAAGASVVCVDCGRAGRHAAAAAELALLPAVEVRDGDVTSDPIEPLLEGVSAVVHLAALPGPRAAHTADEITRQNVLATTRVLETLPRGARFVLASTSSVYGDAARLPTPESWAPAPLNRYAASKRSAEEAVLAAAGAGVDALACRLFTVFGPRQRPDMAFARWISAILSGAPVPWCAHPGSRRDFTYVEDAVMGLTAALRHGRAGEIYNVAGGGSVSVRAALAEIEMLLGRRARLVARPAQREAVVTEACGVKAREELGYVPRTTLREGLRRQLDAALAGAPARAAA
jgi:nucleoside-diphosphate-sugar epimerase